MADERLINTIMALTRGKPVTAGELAERFSVSVRTVHRDLDKLERAGVPVTASRGRGGGLSLGTFPPERALELIKSRSPPELASPAAGTASPSGLSEFVLAVDAAAADRVSRDFPRSEISGSGTGEITLRTRLPENESTLAYIMSYGDKARVIKPNRIRRALRKRFARAERSYS